MCEPSRPACLDRGGQKGETDMELGSWSIIQAPSLLALIPLVVMIVLIAAELVFMYLQARKGMASEMERKLNRIGESDNESE